MCKWDICFGLKLCIQNDLFLMSLQDYIIFYFVEIYSLLLIIIIREQTFAF